MPSYGELFDVHLKYVDYIRAKSHVVHQYTRNISASGSGIEVEVRALLRSFLPQRFHITSGYIISASDRITEPSVSPQVDVIIVDTMVPHSLWLVDQTQGIEMVPVEAVVGLFEVKRTLGLRQLGESIDHLSRIVHSVGIEVPHTQRYLPGGFQIGGGIRGGSSAIPLVGIIGLQSGPDLEASPVESVATANQRTGSHQQLILNMVLCLSGLFVAPRREGTSDYALAITHPATSWSGESKSLGRGGSVALAKGLGYILAYLSETVGRRLNPENYFFNNSLLDPNAQTRDTETANSEGTEAE